MIMAAKETEKDMSQDRKLEEALLKSCLLFSGKNIRNNRELILQKKMMALILEGKVKSRRDMEVYSIVGEANNGKADLTDQVITGLKKQKFIEVDSDGNISLSNKTAEEIKAFSDKFNHDRDVFVNEIFDKVNKEKHVANAVVVKRNIRECVDYYFKTESLVILGYDEREELMSGKIKELACKSLDDGEMTGNLLIEAIGRVIDSPTDRQRDFIESYARAMLTSRIIGKDSLLRNFRTTVIGKKCFLLDTDVVLNCITRNTRRGTEYRRMVEGLLKCGCKLAVPHEVIEEAYDHAEASTKRYFHLKSVIEGGDLGCLGGMRMNVFIEDYMSGKSTGNLAAWNRYIQNYFEPAYGVDLMRNVVKDKLGDKIRYDLDLSKDVKKESDDFRRLYDAVYQETRMSPNAQYREEQKNVDIATVDTLMYLVIREKNGLQQPDDGKKKGVLINDHYILTSSTRAHACASALGIACDVVCSPRALMAYMAECGLLEDKDMSVSGLMDNPFLVYVARNSWDDLRMIVDAGIEVKGKSLVRLQMDVQNQVQTLLTTSDPEEFHKACVEVQAKGYTLNENMQKILQENERLKERLDVTEAQLGEREEQNKRLEANLAKARYEERKRSSKSAIKGVKLK